jgi:hypothetical protein
MGEESYLPLQQTISSSQSVYTIITLTPAPHKSADGICGMLATDDMSIFIDVTNVDLHRGVVLGSDEAASAGT